MKLKEMRERYDALGRDLEALTGKDGDWTDEDSTRARSLLDEMNDLEPKLRTANEAQGAATRARAATSQPAGQRASGLAPVEGAEAQAETRDMRSPGRRFVESEAFAEYRKHPHGTSQGVPAGSFFSRDEDGPTEQRAVLYSGTLSGSTLLAEVLPEIYRAREADLVMRDVLLNMQTTSDTITVLQESGYTNSAAETAEATATNDGAKPESALTFTEASFSVRTIAHWLPVTRQALDDTPFIRGYIEQRLLDGLRRREDGQILNGNGTAPNLRGLLNTSGILTLDAAYFTANPVTNAGQSVENFNRILRAKTRIALSTVGGARATFIVVNPANLETMLTVGDANRQYYGPGPFSGAAITSLWGMTVVADENIAAGTALVGDGTMAAVVDRMDAQVFVADQHSDFFVRNLFVLLAEERIALPVFRPSAFAAVTLA
jgi:HK97 family phage major capsid protein